MAKHARIVIARLKKLKSNANVQIATLIVSLRINQSTLWKIFTDINFVRGRKSYGGLSSFPSHRDARA